MGNQRRRKKLTDEEELEVLETINKSGKDKVLNNIKIDLKAKTPNQKKLINAIKDKEIVICSGLAGSGKTYISCAMAIDLLRINPKYKKIVIVKSVTTLRDEEIGYIKGGVKEKMEPFMYSFTHNFQKIIGKENLEMLKQYDMIEELPIAYMRGINIDQSIVLIDECQNISIDNIRTILTRLGEDSKMIFLGDENQIDMKKKTESSLSFIINKFKDLEEVGTIVLGEDDVVRNPLIKKIERIFNESK